MLRTGNFGDKRSISLWILLNRAGLPSEMSFAKLSAFQEDVSYGLAAVMRIVKFCSLSIADLVVGYRINCVSRMVNDTVLFSCCCLSVCAVGMTANLVL